MDTLEGHYRDMCDIEFTIEKRKLWFLQTRIGKRTAFAEWVMAYDMLQEGLIDADEALLRVDANRLEELFKRRVDETPARGDEPIAKGLNASPGAATGKVVFSADEAQEWAAPRRARDPGPPRDHARRLPRHDRVAGHPDERRRDQLARGRRRARRGHPGGLRRRRDQARLRREGLLRRTARRWPRATSSRSTASPATSTSASCPLEESVLEKARAGDAAARERDDLAGVRGADGPRRRAPAPARPRERRHAGPVDERARARRRGHRPVPDRAHVPREERVAAVQQMIFAETDGGGAGRVRRPAAAPARGLRRDLPGDERAAGDGASARPAAARVPARTRSSWPSRSRSGEERGEDVAASSERDAAEGERAARDQPDARPARRAPGHREARPLRDAGPRDLRGRRPGEEGGRRPAGRDHDPAGRDGAGAAADARRARARSPPRSSQREGVDARPPGVGHDDRAARAPRSPRARSPRPPTSSRSGRTTSRRRRSASAATTSASSSGCTRSASSCPRTRSSRSTGPASGA